MAREQRETRPIIDAINDAVTALTDVVRSVRGRSGGKDPSDLKTRARAAGREVSLGAQEISAEVRRAGEALREHFEGAWEALTSHHGAEANGAPRRAVRRASVRSTARAARSKARTPRS